MFFAKGCRLGFVALTSAIVFIGAAYSFAKSTQSESKLSRQKQATLRRLINELRESDVAVRKRAAERLGAALWVPVVNIGSDEQTTITTSEGLGPIVLDEEVSELPNVSTSELVMNLKRQDAAVRQSSAKQLGSRENLEESAAQALIETAHTDADPSVRAACVEALGNIYAYANVISALERALTDSNAEVRGQAAESLGSQLGDYDHIEDQSKRDAVLQRLSELLNDNSPIVREKAIKAIGNVGMESKRFAPLLVNRLKDSNPDVRLAAVENLRRMSPDPAIVVNGLGDILYDTDSSVRYEAVDYLHTLSVPPGPAVPGLIHIIESDESELIIRPAVEILAQSGEAAIAAVPSLIKVMETADEAMRAEAAQGRNTLSSVLETKNQAMRRTAALAISNIATAAEEARLTDKIDILEKAYDSLAKYDDPKMKDYARNVRRAIDNLVFRRRMFLLVFLEQHPGWITPIVASLFYGGFAALFLLAPVWEKPHRLLMSSLARNVMSLGTVYPLLMVLRPLRTHLLIRYLRAVRAETDFAQWRQQFVIPSEDFLPEKIGTELVKKRKLLFVGQSGIGKTCLFKYLTCRHALKKRFERNLEPSGAIPVFLPLQRYHGLPLEKIFHARLERFGLITDEKLSIFLLKQGGFLVLIDGLNEVDEAARRLVNPFIDTYGNANYICVSSQEAYSEFTWIDRVNMSPLGEVQIRDVLRGRLGSQAEITIREFDQATYELYGIPQDLDFVIEILKQGKPLPLSRSELYDAMLEPILDSWIQAGHADYSYILFNRAYEMLKRRDISFEVENVPLPSEIRDRLVEKKLLMRRGEQYHFRHDLVRAYLAAKYFCRKRSELREDVIIESNWRPMLEFALDLSLPQDAKELLNSLLRRNRQMAGDLFAWLNEKKPDFCSDWADDFKRRYADAVLSPRDLS